MNFAAWFTNEWKKFKTWCEKEVTSAKTEVSVLRSEMTARIVTLEDKVTALEKKL